MILYQIFLPSNQYRIENKNLGNPIMAWIYFLQNRFTNRIDTDLKDTLSQGFIKTLLIGFRNGINPEIIQTFINTGTVHILSISGMHITLIFDLLSKILFPLKRIPRAGKYISYAIILIFLWIYAFCCFGV